MTRLNIKMPTLIAFFLPLALFSCNTIDPEEKAIQRLIGKYNVSIIIAYKELNLLPLENMAGEAQVRKVKTIINSYMEANEVMEAELLSLAFKDIRIESDRAMVSTSEDWSYRWVDFKTGEEVVPLKDIHYEMLYHLIKKDDKWLVDRVEDVGGAREG